MDLRSVLATLGTDGDLTLWDTATWRPYGKPVVDEQAVLEVLAARYPRLRELVAERRLHPSIAASLNANVFIDDPATPLARTDRLIIISADAGG